MERKIDRKKSSKRIALGMFYTLGHPIIHMYMYIYLLLIKVNDFVSTVLINASASQSIISFQSL